MDLLPSNLNYTNQEKPGILRKKCGKGFIYQFPNGKIVTAKQTLSRIEELVIPPMWENVWITKDPKGHIQVTGIDLKGRKQYIYHRHWVDYRQNSKYQRLRFFGQALPAIRARASKDLQLSGWPRNKMLALMVMILDELFIRIGNVCYAKNNGTYGLSTLRRKHVHLNEGMATFEYKAKSGKFRKVILEDEELVPLIKECMDLPGHEIFRYYDEETKCYCNLLSEDVNSYLREITGAEFSAKDFRTWAGSVLTVSFKEEAEKVLEANPRKKLENILVNLVAEKLGNTVSICKTYYIHPTILAAVEAKDLAVESKKAAIRFKHLKRGLEPEEILTLHLLG
ncbi:MAG: DNA topoisomerase IB [Anditalea sp.]